MIKRLKPWCWERLRARGNGDDRGWNGWMASPTQWIWVWVNSGSWWWTRRPGVLQFMGWQSRTWLNDWVTELNGTENYYVCAQLLGCIWLFVRLWPIRLLCPWDFPGKNTAVGCHFLLQNSYIKAPSVSLFGSEASEEVIKFKWGHKGRTLIQQVYCPHEKKH